MIRDVQRQMGSSVVFVTHDMSVHANIADRIGIMYAGRLVEEGPTRTLFAAPRHPYTAHLVAALPRIGDTTPKADARGTTAQPRRTAHRLPLSPSLPARHREVHDRCAATRAGRPGSSLGVLAQRRRGAARCAAGVAMTVIAFPGHAGRCWPLVRWRSLARIVTGVPVRVARGLPRLQALRHGRPALAWPCRCRRGCQSLAVVRCIRDLHDHRRVRVGKDDAGAHDPRPRTSHEWRHPVRGQEQRGTSNPRCPARLLAARAAGVPEPVRDVQSAQAGRSLPVCIGASPLWRPDQVRGGGGDGRCAAQGRAEPQGGRRALCARTFRRTASTRGHRAGAHSQPFPPDRRRAGVDGGRIPANVDRQSVAGSARTSSASPSSTSRTTSPPPTTSPTGWSSCRRDTSWRWARPGRFSTRPSIPIPGSSRSPCCPSTTPAPTHSSRRTDRRPRRPGSGRRRGHFRNERMAASSGCNAGSASGRREAHHRPRDRRQRNIDRRRRRPVVATTGRAGARGRGRPRCCWRGGRRRRAGGTPPPRPGRRAAGCRRPTAPWHRASG